MANLNDLDDVTISNPKVGDVVKYTAQGWQNAADAVGGSVDGNPCGNLDRYTRDDEKETITEPWTWDLDPGECLEVKDSNGSHAHYCPSKAEVSNSSGNIKMQANSDGSGLIQSQGVLSFKDSQVTNGVTLSALLASGGITPGPNPSPNNDANPVMIRKFTFGGSTEPLSESFKQWKNAPGIDSDFRILNWKTSDALSVTLPDWANAAAIIYIQNHSWQFSDDIKEYSGYGVNYHPFRQYSTHALTLSAEAAFRFQGGTDGRNVMVNILNMNANMQPNDATILPGNRRDYRETTNLQIIKLTGSSKTFTITHKIDLLKGGWNRFTCGTGKILLLPTVYDSLNIDELPSTVSSGYQVDPNAFVVPYNDYQDIIDDLYPPETPEEYLMQESRDLKNNIIWALNVCNDALAETPGDETLERIRSDIYALKTESSIDFAEARFNVLKYELVAAIDWRFPWEPAGYSLI